MFLRDYYNAVIYLSTVLGGDCSMCFSSISASMFGDKMCFKVDHETSYIVYRGGRVEKTYPDTWRNPNHKSLIKHGDGRELW